MQLTPQQREQIGLEAGAQAILGMNFASLGRFTEAREAHEAALKLYQEQDDRLGQASSLKLLGQVYQAQGRFADAHTLLDRALALYADEPGGRASTLSNLGLLEYETGRLGAASEYLEQALAALPAGESFRDQDLRATILSNRALVLSGQGLYAQARATLDEALALYEAAGNQERIAVTLINRGALAEREANRATTGRDRDQRNEQALADYQAALKIVAAANLRPLQASVLNNLGTLLAKLERMSEAKTYLEQALAISRELNNPASQALVLVNLADIDQQQARYTEALVRYDEALALAQDTGSQGVQVEALARSARTLVLKGDTAAALPRYEQALDILGQLRAVAGGDAGRSGFSANYADIYERAARLYLTANDPVAAFATVERGRARAFLDSLATGEVQLADAARNERAERFRAAEAALEASLAERNLVRQGNVQDESLLEKLESAVTQAEAERKQALDDLQRDGGQAALVLAGGPTAGDVSTLQQQLPAETTLLAYQVGEESTLAFVVTRERLEAVELPVGRTELMTSIRALLGFDDEARTTERAANLYNDLIAPVRGQLTTPRLIVVPHGVLHYVPFALLRPDGQRFLGDDFRLSLLPAAALLPYVQRPFQPLTTGADALVLANADRDGAKPVPGVEQAAERIGQLFGAQPLLGDRATKAALFGAADQARMLHIGAHGEFVLTDTLRSSLQLYTGDGGRLTTEEVYRLPLGEATLVTLSACETQVNQLADPTAPIAVTAGDDIVGLQRAFFVAGTRNVITTLWEVPDQASQLLMERFYQELRAGLPPADALQRAQQEVRTVYPDEPQAWAGFVLSGVGDKALVTPPWWQRVPWWGWAIVVGAVLIILGGVLLRRPRQRKEH